MYALSYPKLYEMQALYFLIFLHLSEHILNITLGYQITPSIRRIASSYVISSQEMQRTTFLDLS